MGWASGSRLFSDVIVTITRHVPDKQTRKAIYRELIEAFESHDWDTLDECLDQDEAYDEVFREIYPDDEEADQ